MATILVRDLEGTKIQVEIKITDNAVKVKFLGDVSYNKGDTLALCFDNVDFIPDGVGVTLDGNKSSEA